MQEESEKVKEQLKIALSNSLWKWSEWSNVLWESKENEFQASPWSNADSEMTDPIEWGNSLFGRGGQNFENEIDPFAPVVDNDFILH